MNSTFGDFHMKEIDGEQYLVYHLDNSDEPNMSSSDNNNRSDSTYFLCPALRFGAWREQYADLHGEQDFNNMKIIELDFPPNYVNNVNQEDEFWSDYCQRERLDPKDYHYVLPLSWCKNKYGDDGDDDAYNEVRYPSLYSYKTDGYTYCQVCVEKLKIGTHYYFCVKCDSIYHKECVESPSEIKHPYHPNHPLKLFVFKEGVDGGHGQRKVNKEFVYHCTICNVNVDNICALKPIPFVMEKTKRHDHSLTFFTRNDHLRCNVCGLIDESHHTYACFKCNFVVHQDCVNFPNVIRICRHHHRIRFISSLPPGKWFCGVCRKNVDSDYGAYTCKSCDDYVVHPRCALRRDIWDRKELEGIPEEDDIEEILEPFKTLSEGVILHFLHDHCLKSETIGDIYDDRKICHACVLPIYEGKFYSCMECDFILHDSCANAPCKKRHPLHPHPLTLKTNITGYDSKGYFKCDACCRLSSSFVYECNIKEGCFRIDVRCGSISEPFVYQGHKHPLFLALDPEERQLCQICQEDDRVLINCIECDFIICLRCVNLPYKVKYKHDKHFLTLVHGKETDDPNWCEICEKILFSSKKKEVKTHKKNDYEDYYEMKYKKERGEDIEDKRFYECKQCCTALHINCLLGNLPYMKPGHTIIPDVETVLNSSFSRPFCGLCNDRCVDKIYYKLSYEGRNHIGCCLGHGF